MKTISKYVTRTQVRSFSRRKLSASMLSKRKFCEQCGNLVSDRTYRRHSDLRAVESSDEEENEQLLENFLQNNEEVLGEVHEVVDNLESLPGNADISM